MTYDPFKDFETLVNNAGVTVQTQQIRFKAINELIEEYDGELPTDKDGRSYLLSLLDSTDRTAIQLMRLESKEREGDKDREVAMMTSKLLAEIKNNPFEIDGAVAVDMDHMDSEPLGSYDLVPGEMEIGVQSITYEEIMGDQTTF